MGASHIVTGAVAGSWLAAAVGGLGLVPDHIAVLVIPVVAAAAVLPDLDTHSSTATYSLGPITMLISWVLRGCPRRWLVDGCLWSHRPISYGWGLEHRGPTHTPRGALVFGAVTAATTVWLPEYGWWWWLWALAVTVGCLTHCWADARTHSGIPHPLGHTDRRGRPVRFNIGRTFRTGSPYERWLLAQRYTPAAVASAAASIWLVTS